MPDSLPSLHDVAKTIDALPLPAALIDAQGVIVSVNQAFLEHVRHHGYSSRTEDWTGRPVARATGKSKRETTITADLDLAGLRKAREGHDSEFRPAIVYNRKDGWVMGRT